VEARPVNGGGFMTRSSESAHAPHVAGFREDYWEAATALFAEDLRRSLAGETAANIVDKLAGS
jgi:phosphoglycerate dehydrogenase-like enzyme